LLTEFRLRNCNIPREVEQLMLQNRMKRESAASINVDWQRVEVVDCEGSDTRSSDRRSPLSPAGVEREVMAKGVDAPELYAAKSISLSSASKHFNDLVRLRTELKHWLEVIEFVRSFILMFVTIDRYRRE
jgi:hypothetical protein